MIRDRGSMAGALRGLLLRVAALAVTGMAALARRAGFHLLRRNYYAPVPEESDLAYEARSELVGLELDAGRSFALLDSAIAPYRPELADVPVDAPVPGQPFYLLNGLFMAIDAQVYYGLVRHLKPARIVEIGSGFSTLVALRAVERNVAEGKRATEVLCVEPYPMEELSRAAGDRLRLVAKPVQAVPMDVFTSLGEGDVLFIDSTHVLKSGGDVWYEYCEILPRLAPGVWVHVHDISLPAPYPRAYHRLRRYWNEQYVLQAYLTHNSRVEIVWPGNWLMHRDPARMTAAFSPEYGRMRERFPASEPSSLWFRTR